MTIKKTRPSPFENQSAPKPTPHSRDAPADATRVEITAPKTGRIVKICAVVGQQVEREKTVLYEMECSGADAAAHVEGGTSGRGVHVFCLLFLKPVPARFCCLHRDAYSF